MDDTLTRERILTALGRLSELLAERDAEGEICLLGGTVMVLAFEARPSTKDVDAIFRPAALIRELARVVREEQGLPEAWINDGAKGFVSANHEEVVGDLPQFSNLRLTAPTPRYLLAMKCMSARVAAGEGEKGDAADIVFLARLLGLRSAEEVVENVTRYYPANRIAARTRFLIEDLFPDAKPPEDA